MPYQEISFHPIYSEEEKSILIAELLEAGFDSFTEEENSLLAYIETGRFSDNLLDTISFLDIHREIKYCATPLEDKNWNKEWESSYQPVIIDGKCFVRAPFHPSAPGFPYEIIIEPKMAFGTAHHETTRLMASWLMKLDVSGKTLLDMGCGTGILAILANKMGAAFVTGIDNDEWASRNAMENFMINNVSEGEVFTGDASLLAPSSFDLILANINRNVLICDMKAYADALKNEGLLLLSGFYQSDREAVIAAAMPCGLKQKGTELLNDWAVLLLAK